MILSNNRIYPQVHLDFLTNQILVCLHSQGKFKMINKNNLINLNRRDSNVIIYKNMLRPKALSNRL